MQSCLNANPKSKHSLPNHMQSYLNSNPKSKHSLPNHMQSYLNANYRLDFQEELM